MLKKGCFFLILLLSAALYLVMAYQVKRTEFYLLISIYSSLFILYALLLTYFSDEYRFLCCTGILFRLMLIASVPNLSDDVYRFIWDGQLIHSGINPFMYTPAEILQLNLLTPDPTLFGLLNSKEYYSVYPPFCQLIFAVSSALSNGSWVLNIIFLKAFILLAEIGSLFILEKLLKTWNVDRKALLLYALNPLVILELSGNIHFEAFMIFFVLTCLYFFYKQQYFLSASMLALAIGSKLIPLFFLPLLLRPLGLKKFLVYTGTVFLISALLFIPFFQDTAPVKNFLQSIRLYWEKFEFNSGIYYSLRWFGYLLTGYNQIGLIGKLLAGLLIAGMAAAVIRLKKAKQIPEYFFWILVIYLLLATTVHPWYLCPLIALSCFFNYRFAVVWSALIPFTYITYRTTLYMENLWLVFFEYLIVIGFMIGESTILKRYSIKFTELLKNRKPGQNRVF